jgi:hypothetical protein
MPGKLSTTTYPTTLHMLLPLPTGEPFYLSPSHDGPVMYINIEDHLTYATGRPNTWFQGAIQVLRSPVCGPARLHWGKAGWPQHAACFDGAAEYGDNWCHFGCAAQQLDPGAKFAGQAAGQIWQWGAAKKGTEEQVSLSSCCNSNGFDTSRCSCARRAPCQS